MEETLKVVISIVFGAVYFWILSRRKKKPARPNEVTPPVTKVIVPMQRPKTTMGKILADLEKNLQIEIPQHLLDISTSDIKNPTLLTRKEQAPSLSLHEEKKIRTATKQQAEGGIKRASEKIDDFTAEIDAEDLMNKERDKAYKLAGQSEHPIMKLVKDSDNLKNAIILAEILQKKH